MGGMSRFVLNTCTEKTIQSLFRTSSSSSAGTSTETCPIGSGACRIANQFPPFVALSRGVLLPSFSTTLEDNSEWSADVLCYDERLGQAQG